MPMVDRARFELASPLLCKGSIPFSPLGQIPKARGIGGGESSQECRPQVLVQNIVSEGVRFFKVISPSDNPCLSTYYNPVILCDIESIDITKN